MKQDSIPFSIIPPPPDLADVVCTFWEMTTDPSARNPLPFRVVADGRPGILIPDKTTSTESSVSKAVLYGQNTGYDDLHFEPGTRLTGVVFHSHVLKLLFGFDADEITNRKIDLNLISPVFQNNITGRQTIEKQILSISACLRILKSNNRPSDPVVRQSVVAIRRSSGTLPLASLRNIHQLSERQFERRFKQHTGIPPILFLRISRFQSALQQVRNRRYQKLSDVAYDRGYADQAHFIREFKEFSGFLPGSYHTSDSRIQEICQM